jgi:hypothetical protein
VIDIHETELDAVHAQPASVVTLTVPLPEVAGADAVLGDAV